MTIIEDSTSKYLGHVETVTDTKKDENGKVISFKTIGGRTKGVEQDHAFGKHLLRSRDWGKKDKEKIRVGGRKWRVIRAQKKPKKE